MSYFKNGGIQYLPGGKASGFVHVDRDAYRNRLLHLKGKRVVRAKEVELSAASLNTGDVFLLDTHEHIYLVRSHLFQLHLFRHCAQCGPS